MGSSMKGSNRFDIVLLLSLLVLFGVGVSLLYGKAPLMSDLQQYEDQKLMIRINPLIVSRAITKIADVLAKEANEEQQVRILTKILSKKELMPEEKISLALLLMLRIKETKQRNAFLDVLFKEASTELKDIPVLALAAEKNYDSIIPDILNRLSGKPNDVRAAAYDALMYAIKNDSSVIPQKLMLYKTNITADDATQLLWEVVNLRKGDALVRALVKMGANPNDSRAGKTLLIAAVEKNEQDTVDALLAEGADINLIKDPKVPTALQMAIEKGYAEIEILLRKKGAKE